MIKLNSKTNKFGKLLIALAMLTTFIVAPAFADEPCDHAHWDKSQRSEFFEKHNAVLHDKLGLTKDQESEWDIYKKNVTPVRDHAERPARSELSKLTTPERLDFMLSMMKKRQQAMESRAQAIKAFYAHLTPEQQKIFDDSFHHNASKNKTSDAPRSHCKPK